MKVYITISEIMEYLFCPRFIYFMFCQSTEQHEEKRFKVLKGRVVHEDKTNINKDYLRKKIGVTNKEVEVYLASERLHIKGVVDEVLTLEDGTMAPLDYKFAEYNERVFKTHRIQSVTYGMLISENYKMPVRKGFVVYTRSKNKLVDIEFTQKDFDELKKIIHDILLIIQKNYYPKKTTSDAKCDDCTFRNICV